MGVVVDADLLFPYAAAAGSAFTERLVGQRPLFVCVIASTDTALVPGISAAGVSAELIPFTAAADAEVLAHGSARCIPGVPSNPLGPPGPSIITLAALQLADIPHLIVNAGCRVGPDAPCVDLCGYPGGHIVDGAAVRDVAKLFDRGRDLGADLAAEHPYLVIGESVPGGTTTALALLLALGIAADGRISSSIAGNAHSLKSRVAHEALARLPYGLAARDPLGAVGVLGDPMQAAVAGIAAGALARNVPVLLAGGSQMVAVLALLRRIEALGRAHIPRASVAVGTTRWVVEDPTADVVGLMRQVGGAPLIATALSFAGSKHATLRRYEDYLVKEGVGAGGAAIAANLCAGIICAELLDRTEHIYERIQDGSRVLTP